MTPLREDLFEGPSSGEIIQKYNIFNSKYYKVVIKQILQASVDLHQQKRKQA